VGGTPAGNNFRRVAGKLFLLIMKNWTGKFYPKRANATLKVAFRFQVGEK
jgi:hypothetical protein